VPSPDDACVVIPTHNERDNVVRLAERLRALAPGLRLVVVDDASPDGTAAAAEEAARRLAPMRVIRRGGKEGRGSACLAGFRAALADPGVRAVVEMDADFSHDPAELPETLAALARADVVVRSRYVPGSRLVDWPASRRAFSAAANALARAVLGATLADYTNGYRAYSRAAAEALAAETLETPGYFALAETVVRLREKGFRFAELPTTFVDRRRGASNLTWREIAGAAAGLARLARRRRA